MPPWELRSLPCWQGRSSVLPSMSLLFSLNLPSGRSSVQPVPSPLPEITPPLGKGSLFAPFLRTSPLEGKGRRALSVHRPPEAPPERIRPCKRSPQI